MAAGKIKLLKNTKLVIENNGAVHERKFMFLLSDRWMLHWKIILTMLTSMRILRFVRVLEYTYSEMLKALYPKTVVVSRIILTPVLNSFIFSP